MKIFSSNHKEISFLQYWSHHPPIDHRSMWGLHTLSLYAEIIIKQIRGGCNDNSHYPLPKPNPYHLHRRFFLLRWLTFILLVTVCLTGMMASSSEFSCASPSSFSTLMPSILMARADDNYYYVDDLNLAPIVRSSHHDGEAKKKRPIEVEEKEERGVHPTTTTTTTDSSFATMTHSSGSADDGDESPFASAPTSVLKETEEQEDAYKEGKELEELTTGVLFLVMLIFLGGTFFLTCEKMIPLPHTVVLFLYGLAVGGVTLWIAPGVGGALGNIPPDLLFFIFLPVLIFEGSYSMNSYAFRRVAGQTILLATVGILINTAILAVAVKLMFIEWSWYTACLLGSLLSATDPVAVVSLLKNLRVDKYLTAMVDGEAVMNDGTAIIIFTILMPAELAGHLTDSFPVMILTAARLLLLPVILGPIFGFIQLFWIRRTPDPLAKACITVSVSYVSYYIAMQYVGTSAVLTLCFEGVFLSYYHPSVFPGKESNFVSATWEFLVHLSNTLLFSLVGVILVEDVLSTVRPVDIFLIIVLYVVMIIARFVMLEVMLPLVNLFPRKITQRDVLLLTHAGLRGGVAVTLALAVKQRDVAQGVPILKLTSGVVLLTLMINATTAGLVVEALGFKVKEEYRHIEMRYGMRYIKDAELRALEAVKRDTKYKNTNWHLVEKYLNKHLKNPYRDTAMAVEGEELSLNRLTMSAFKASLWRQREELVISETVIHQLSLLSNNLIEKGKLLDVRRLSLYYRHEEAKEEIRQEEAAASAGHRHSPAPPHASSTSAHHLAHQKDTAPHRRYLSSSQHREAPRRSTSDAEEEMDLTAVHDRKELRDLHQKSPPAPLAPLANARLTSQQSGEVSSSPVMVSIPPYEAVEPGAPSPLANASAATTAASAAASKLMQSFTMLLPRLDGQGPGSPSVRPSANSRRKKRKQRRATTGEDTAALSPTDEDDDDEDDEDEEDDDDEDDEDEREEGRLRGLDVAVENVGAPEQQQQEGEEVGQADETSLALMKRLLPAWVVLAERVLGNGFFESAHRRAQENAFMMILAIVKCLTALSTIKYQHVTSADQARRINRWLHEQLLTANACINFFYSHFPEATNFVSSTRAVLSVTNSIQEAIETLHLKHGFGMKMTEMMEDLVTDLRDHLPASWGKNTHQKEIDLVMRAVASTTLGKGLRRAEISAITAMGLVRKFKEGDVITLPNNAFLVVVFGSLRSLRHPWTTAHAEHDQIESFGDTVGLEAFLLPAALRIVDRRRWEVITGEATALLISFQSIQPFLTERSLRAVKALWRAAAVEAILPILQNMVTVPMREDETAREHLMGLVMAGTPLIGPEDCNRFREETPFHLCFYLRGTDAKGFYTPDSPPCHVSTFFLHQVEWTSPDVVLYVVPVNISDGGYVPWGSSGVEEEREEKKRKKHHHAKNKKKKNETAAGAFPSAVGLMQGHATSAWTTPTATPPWSSARLSPQHAPTTGSGASHPHPPTRPTSHSTAAALHDRSREGEEDTARPTTPPSYLSKAAWSHTTDHVFNAPSVTEEGNWSVNSSEFFDPRSSEVPQRQPHEDRVAGGRPSPEEAEERSHSPPEKYIPSSHAQQMDQATFLDGTDTLASMNDSQNALGCLRQPIPRFQTTQKRPPPPTNSRRGNEAAAAAAVADAAAAASSSATFGTAQRVLSDVLMGVVPMNDMDVEIEGLSGGESTELLAATLEASTTFGSPLRPGPGGLQGSFSGVGMCAASPGGPESCCCVLQCFSRFVSPVPLVNQLFGSYASTLEQLCIAALRYVLLPSDPLNIRHAQRICGGTVEFLLKFAMQMQLLQQALEGIHTVHHSSVVNSYGNISRNAGDGSGATAASGDVGAIGVSSSSCALLDEAFLDGKKLDAAFHIKVCQWVHQAERCGRYHLRSMILSMRAYANRRFEAIVHTLQRATVMAPELGKVENVNGLYSFVQYTTTELLNTMTNVESLAQERGSRQAVRHDARPSPTSRSATSLRPAEFLSLDEMDGGDEHRGVAGGAQHQWPNGAARGRASTGEDGEEEEPPGDSTLTAMPSSAVS